MTKLGPCRVFTPKQRRAIADRFYRGMLLEKIAETALDDPLMALECYSDALEAVEDSIRWVYTNGRKPKKRSKI